MDPTHTITLDPSIFERNLAAIEKTGPELATQLDKKKGSGPFCAQHPSGLPGKTDLTPFPVEPIPTTTRDGQTNFRLVRPDGSWEWFGRTSIPTVRAEAILARSDMGNANILLPAIGEGTEAALITKRLTRHRALFVWEENPTAMYLALQLHDLADAIADERFIPLVCPLDNLAHTLASWLIDHPGHLCPRRLLMWPWQTVMDLNPCRVALETAAQTAESQKQHVLQKLRTKPARSANPHIALLAINSDDTTLEMIEALSAGAAELGYEATDLAIRRPCDVHPLARVTRLAETGMPELAVLVDTTRREICDVLPDDVPAVTWLSARTPIRTNLISRISPNDPVAVTGARRRDQMIAGGIDADRVHVCPPACLAPPADSEPIPGSEHRPIDLLILADLSPLEPERFGYTLNTHTKIWNTAIDLLRTRIEHFTDDQAPALLARAEKKAAAAIEDDDLRNAMIEHLANPVANTLAWSFFAQTIAEHEVTLEIRGFGWRELGQPLANAAQRHALLAQATTVLHLDVTGEASPTVMAAAGHGSLVLAHRHPRDKAPGGLATLLTPGDEYLPFDGVRDLLTTLHDLLAGTERLGQITQKARSRCLSHHMPEHRLATLRAIASP